MYRLKAYVTNLLVFCFAITIVGQETLYQLGADQMLTKDFELLVEEGVMDSLLVLCESIINNESKPIQKATAFYYKARVEEDYSQFDLAVLSYKDAEAMFKKHNHYKGLSKVYLKHAELNERLGKYQKADSLLVQSIKFARLNDLQEILVSAHQERALILNK